LIEIIRDRSPGRCRRIAGRIARVKYSIACRCYCPELSSESHPRKNVRTSPPVIAVVEGTAAAVAAHQIGPCMMIGSVSEDDITPTLVTGIVMVGVVLKVGGLLLLPCHHSWI
jgi:hypothetical protein